MADGESSLTEREKELFSVALELQERLNKATAIALHFHPCADEHKSAADHLDEVYASLKQQGLIEEMEYYDVMQKNGKWRI